MGVALAQSPDPASVTDTTATDTTVAQQAPPPPPELSAEDTDNDNGESITVHWEKSPADTAGGDFAGYYIYRSQSQGGPFEQVGDAAPGATQFEDNDVKKGVTYWYKIGAFRWHVISASERTPVTSVSTIEDSAVATVQYFHGGRVIAFILVIFVAGAIIMYIRKARRGEKLYVRKIAGIDAVEEAVGRATEMGKKIFYIPGIQDMNDVQTIAGIAILGRVAEKAAEYETWLEVPVSKSMVMVTARETMKEAYAKVGRPDNYQEGQVHYLTDDQFGYAAAIDGMVVREKPATIFYMGAFFAESLILAETGNAAGAIQIAGTAMPSQLPFFVAACDYTLIGEELFAASAYLSREPRQLGSLKGQDVGKALFMILIIVGTLLLTVHLFDLGPYIKPDQINLRDFFTH